jgi:hypothetical protein
VVPSYILLGHVGAKEAMGAATEHDFRVKHPHPLGRGAMGCATMDSNRITSPTKHLLVQASTSACSICTTRSLAPPEVFPIA